MHTPDLPVVVVGAGPAGLIAAERLAQAGQRVQVFDAMPSVGRKFLLAGKGGMNLTHSEPFERFATRYGARRAQLEPLLRRFDADALRRWAAALGIDTFIGSSGRVFPTDMKAAPLLRAWLHRLRGLGVAFHMRHRWVGFDADGDAPPVGALPPALTFDTPQGPATVHARAVVLALGGASWPQLGSTGAWVPLLAQRGVDVAPLVPSNCGFDVGRVAEDGSVAEGWSDFLRSRFAGAPLKTVALRFEDGAARFEQRGEFVLTASGVEGSLVYAASSLLREAIARHGRAVPTLDLLPDRSADFVAAEVARPRGPRSLSTHLKTRLHLDGAKAALLHELLPKSAFAPGADPAALAAAIKALPLPLVRPRPIAEAISSAGGVRFEAMDEATLALRVLPGVWCAGEMLDWEAPTGGYLLTACFATGVAVADGVVQALRGH